MEHMHTDIASLGCTVLTISASLFQPKGIDCILRKIRAFIPIRCDIGGNHPKPEETPHILAVIL